MQLRFLSLCKNTTKLDLSLLFRIMFINFAQHLAIKTQFLQPNMKKLPIAILILTCLMLASCSWFNGVSSQLAAADNIIEQYPDSAYRMLNRISGADLTSPSDSAYYGLLYSQARYKLEKKTDPALISNSIKYYQQHDNPALLQRCYYYYGSILEDNGSSDTRDIILSYKQAEHLIPEVNDTLMILRIYEALAVANIKSFIPTASLKYAKLELQTAKTFSDKSWITSGLFETGQAMYFNNLIDSATYYMQRLENIAIKEEPRARALIYNNIAAFYMEENQPDYSKVEKYILLSLKDDSLETSFSMLAKLYLKTGREKQAIDILNKLSLSNSNEMKMSAYGSLEDYYANKHEYSKAYEMTQKYDSLFIIIDDSMSKINLNEIQMKYDNEIIVRNYKRTRGKIIFAVEFATIILLIVILILYKKSYKRKILLTQYKHLLDQTKYELVSLRNDKEKTINEKEAKIKRILAEKKKIMSDFEDRLSSKDIIYSSQLQSLEQSLKYIFHLAKEDNFSQYDKKDREAFIELYRMFEPNFVKRLENIETGVNLTVQEKIYCILRDMNKDDLTIQKMFCWSDEALRKTRSRAINKLKQDKYAKYIVDKIC